MASAVPAPSGGLLATQPSKLLSSPVNISALREDAWRELIALLDSLEGRITIICDPALEPALRLTVPDGNLKSLRDYRVQPLSTSIPLTGALNGDGMISLLDTADPPPSSTTSSEEGNTLLYLVRPLPEIVRLVAAQIKGVQKRLSALPGSSRQHVSFHCAMSPRRTFLAEAVLKSEGLLTATTALSSAATAAAEAASSSGSDLLAGGKGKGSGSSSSSSSSSGGMSSSMSSSSSSSSSSVPLVSISEFQGFEVVPVDDDLLLLASGFSSASSATATQDQGCLGDTTLFEVATKGNTASLHAVTQALAKLQSVFGPFGSIKAKGPLAGLVVEQLLRLKRETEGVSSSASSSSSSSSLLHTSSKAEFGSGSGSAAAAAAAAGFNLSSAINDTRTYQRNFAGTASSSSFSSKQQGGSSSSSTGSGKGAGSSSGSNSSTGEIDSCIILDRLVDWVTPLLTSLTYESLLDELGPLGSLQAGSIATVDSALLADPVDKEEEEKERQRALAAAAAAGKKGAPPPPAPSGTQFPPTAILHLNSNLKLYSELRDCNIQKAGPRLAARAKEMQALRDSITKAKASDLAVSDIRRFVKQIPGLQADMRLLRVLISVTEPLKKSTTDDQGFLERWQLERTLVDEDLSKSQAHDVISNLIYRRLPLLSTLRLLCLQSVIEGGFKHKVFDAFKRALLQSYGHSSVLPRLKALEASTLLSEKDGIFSALSSAAARVAEGEGEGGGGGGGGGIFGSLASAASTATPWSSLRKGFGLTTAPSAGGGGADDIDVEEPLDLHYAYSGYAPLSIRLVQAALCLPSLALLSLQQLQQQQQMQAMTAGGGGSGGGSGGAAGAAMMMTAAPTLTPAMAKTSPSFAGTAGWLQPQVSDLLRLLPGPVWNVVNTTGGGSGMDGDGSGAGGSGSGGAGGGAGVQPGGAGASNPGAAGGAGEGSGASAGGSGAGVVGGGAGDGGMMTNRKVCLVVFVGGVTPTELSCLRFIAERTSIDFLVLATSVVNGSRLLQQVMGPGTEADPRLSQFAAAAASSSSSSSTASGRR